MAENRIEIEIENFDYPEQDPTATTPTTETQKVDWIKIIVISLLFGAFLLNVTFSVSDTVETHTEFKKIATLIKSLGLDLPNLKTKVWHNKYFKNKLQKGSVYSYINNNTKVLTIFCYPHKIIRQFTLEKSFNFSECD